MRETPPGRWEALAIMLHRRLLDAAKCRDGNDLAARRVYARIAAETGLPRGRVRRILGDREGLATVVRVREVARALGVCLDSMP